MALQATNQQGWKRTRYPLQAGWQTTAETSQHVKSPPSPQLLQRSYPAATPGPPSLASPGPTDRQGLPNLQPTTDPNHSTDRGSENIKMDHDLAETGSISSRSSSMTTTSAASYHNATTMSPIMEKERDETEQQSEPSTPDLRTKSLRRSQRNQRLEARLSKGNMHEAAQPPQSGPSVMDAAVFSRQTSPDRGTPGFVSMLEHAFTTPTSETESKENGGLHQSRGRDRATPASPPSSESEADSKRSSNSHQTNKSHAKTERWRSCKYPLQMPGVAQSQQLPTPPLSPMRKTEHQPQNFRGMHSSPAQHVTAASTTSHQSYPLQSPVTAVQTQHSAGQDTETSAGPNAVKAEEASVVNSEEKSTSSNSEKKDIHRQLYPLQSPASTGDLKASRLSSSSNRGHQPKEAQIQPEPRTQPHTRTFSRGKYPLQSPADTATPGQSQTPSTPGPRDASQQKEPAKIVTQNTPPRRQGYPLQSPTSATGAQSPSLETHDGPTTGVRNSTNNRQPSGAPLSRRSTYPLQPLITTPSNQRRSLFTSPSSTGSENGTEYESSGRYPPPPYLREDRRRQSSKVFLPKNIRAVRNSEHKMKGRTIVVCLDGTGDKFDDDNSNIVHLVSALKKDDEHQVTYYQAGIGTYNDGGLSSGFASALDMAVGSGLGLHVRDAYQFLMHSYKEGDRVCIFGFSRGAYTARCLAGMVHKVGLLPPRNLQQIQFAYEFYKDDSEHGWKQSNDFKRAFSIEVNIHFLGCFDSVASVGFIPRQLPLSSTPNNKPRYFRHAMALDERRAKFKVCRYQSAQKQGQLGKATEPGVNDDSDDDESHASKLLDKVTNSTSQNDTPPQYSASMPYGKDNHPNMTEAEYDRLYGHEEDFDTDVSEVWFAGCHADVGGGAVANTERHKLAQIPLRWMIRQAFECNTGIIFKTRMLAEYGLDVHSLWPKYGRLEVPGQGPRSPPFDFLSKYDKKLPPRSVRRSKLVPVERREQEFDERQGVDRNDRHGEPWYHLKSPDDADWTPEQVEDYYDAMTPMNDQLVQAPTWWILETLPVQYKMCYEAGKIVTVVGPNMGLARLVEEHEAQIHWTVLQRARKLGYKAAARPAIHTEWRVVT